MISLKYFESRAIQKCEKYINKYALDILEGDAYGNDGTS